MPTKKGEEPVLARLHGGDVAGEAGELISQLFVWLSKRPPELSPTFAGVLVALWLDVGEQMLIHTGMQRFEILNVKRKGVDNHRPSGPVGEILAVSIIPYYPGCVAHG